MRKSNRNLDIPPPRHTPGNLDFDVLVRSNSLHIFVIPVQSSYCEKLEFKYPTPCTNWKLQHFVILELQSFSFLQKTLFNRSKPFSCSQPRTKLISSHLNSSIVIDAILDSAHMFKRKIQIPDP